MSEVAGEQLAYLVTSGTDRASRSSLVTVRVSLSRTAARAWPRPGRALLVSVGPCRGRPGPRGRPQLSGVRVEHDVGHGGHDSVLLEVLHLAVQLAQGIGRIGELQRVRAQGAAHAAHDHRGAEPGSRDVANYHGQLAQGQDEHVIPVAADAAGPRHIPGGELHSPHRGQPRGTGLRCRAAAGPARHVREWMSA